MISRGNHRPTWDRVAGLIPRQADKSVMHWSDSTDPHYTQSVSLQLPSSLRWIWCRNQPQHMKHKQTRPDRTGPDDSLRKLEEWERKPESSGVPDVFWVVGFLGYVLWTGQILYDSVGSCRSWCDSLSWCRWFWPAARLWIIIQLWAEFKSCVLRMSNFLSNKLIN